VIEGEGRARLARVFADIAGQGLSGEARAQAQEKAKLKAYRAPTIITVICSPVPHPKIPKHEQEHSAAAACQNIVNAAFMLGLGAIWRTGPLVEHEITRQVLKLRDEESIMGFIYVGQPQEMPPEVSLIGWEKKVEYIRAAE
jgi:nitroreductase